MNQEQRLPGNTGFIVGVIVIGLIVGGGITILAIYPTTDKTSFYLGVAAIVLSPIFLVAAFLVNRKRQLSDSARLNEQEWGFSRDASQLTTSTE